jgi:hypothetical protein
MSGIGKTRVALLLTFLFVLLITAPAMQASSTGKPNSSSGCGSCHGNSAGGVTPQITGFPSSYNPQQSYSLTIGGTGTPAGSNGGFSLTTNLGTFSNPGNNAKIVGNSATHSNSNARSWTVTWTSPSQGSGTAVLDLAVNFVNGDGNQSSADNWATITASATEQQVSNDPPLVSNLVISPSSPTKASGLQVSYTYSDPNSDPESGTTIRWIRDSQIVTALNDLTSVSGASVTHGQQWSVEITPSDGTDFGTQVSTGPVTIANSVPSAANPVINPVSPVESDLLIVNYGYDDLDGDLESGSQIQWFLDGSRVSELDDSNSVSSLMTRSGDSWHYTVSPSDGIDIGSTVSCQPVTIGSSNSIPTLLSPVLSPSSPTTSLSLSANWLFDDDDGESEADFEVEWLLSNIHQPAFDDLKMLPTSATSKNDVWSFRARASDGIDWSGWVTSSSQTVINSLPIASNITLNPNPADSSSSLTLSYQYSDDDGDMESGTNIKWYRNGALQNQLTGNNLVDTSEIQRGEVWHAEVTPNDGSGWGIDYQSNQISISNSNPIVEVISINSSGTEFTSLNELILSMQTSDEDADQLVTTIIWRRDGFHIPALDGLSSVPIQWLGIGQLWLAEVTLDDGNGGIIVQQSAGVTIVNIQPVADFSISQTVMTESYNPLDAVLSSDADGEIVGWFWEWEDINGAQTSSESAIEVILVLGVTDVKLTVFDEYGGTSDIIKSVNAIDGPTVSACTIDVSNGMMTLTWDWDGQATEFVVWRLANTDSGGVSDWARVATVNQSTWSEPLTFSGESSYQVSVIIDGVENNRAVAGESQVSVSLSADDMLSQEREDISSSAQLVMLILFTLGAISAIGSATIERLFGGGS